MSATREEAAAVEQFLATRGESRLVTVAGAAGRSFGQSGV